MDQAPRTAPVTSPGGGPRRASIVAGAIVVAVALAIAKPWSLGPAGQAAGATAGEPRATATTAAGSGHASTSPSAPVGDPDAMACLAGETEQVLTFERSTGREVRSWIAVPEPGASGPLDPRLVPVTIFSSHVVGIGVCAASANAGTSPRPEAPGAGRGSGAMLTDAWSIITTAGVAVAVDLGPPRRLTGRLNGSDPALLYGPPDLDGPLATTPVVGGRPSGPPLPLGTGTTGSPSPSPALPAWQAGSYAIAFRFSFDDRTIVRWLRVDLVVGAGGGA